MKPVSLAQFRALSRAAPAHAWMIWSDGLAITYDEAACASAAAGMAEADFGGYRYGVIGDIAEATDDLRLPRPLLAAVRMEPGWLGRDGNSAADRPLQQVGAALALLALAAAQANRSPGTGEIRAQAGGGILVQRH